MTPRERFLGVADGTLTNHLYLALNLNVGWFMEETLERWHGEGLQEGADLAERFGLDRVCFTGGAPYSPMPAFDEEVLSEDAETRVVRDRLGAVLRVFKRDTASKMPQWLEYPIKTRDDWLTFRERLDPNTPARYPKDWDEFERKWTEREEPLGLAPGSFFGHTLQRWVGTEHLCILLCEQPEFVHEMMEYLEGFFLALIKPFLERAQFDFASFGEDIAYKGRSFISPRMFREFIQPHYRSITSAIRANGVRTIFVDSDGCIDELIPLWMEVGINGFSPLEIAAGTDPLALKREYGRDIVLAGGIDKRALARGKDAIDAEVEKAKRLLELGGYFPMVDHSTPPDVPLWAFEHLLEGLRE